MTWGRVTQPDEVGRVPLLRRVDDLLRQVLRPIEVAPLSRRIAHAERRIDHDDPMPRPFRPKVLP